MGAYIFAIIGMLIVIPILYFLPLGFSTGGTFLIAGIAFTAALLFILLQNILDLWTALLAGVGIILISAIALQRKGESFILEAADHEDEDLPDSLDDINEEDVSAEPVQQDDEEPFDIIIHNEAYMQEKHDDVIEEDLPLPDHNPIDEQDESSESEAEPEQSEISEDHEEREMAELFESRNHMILRVPEPEIISAYEKPEAAEKDEVPEADRSWLESAAVLDTEAAPEDLKTKEPEQQDEEPVMNQEEQLFFTNLRLEEDDPEHITDTDDSDKKPAAEEPESTESLILAEGDIREEPEDTSEPLPAHNEETGVERQLDLKDADLSLYSEDQKHSTEEQLSEDKEVTLAESATENGEPENFPGPAVIDEQIFNLITSEFDSHKGADIEELENEIRETLNLTSDPSQQFALYRILLEQMVHQQLITEALTLSNEVSETFENEFIDIEMKELRNLLSQKN
ncbi:phage holin family protein [Jeotgalibacillus sp. JSM ZJ347]|uniref:phage holin family protein n=1 Tax=Jeotgalibacillus sp. JSM ZJ347 TaxID=3342117 RepID=UPI0035A8E8D4